MQRKFEMSISLEYDLEAVQTAKTTVSAGSWPVAFSRAAKFARKAFPGARPRSIVIVLEQFVEKTTTVATEASAVVVS